MSLLAPLFLLLCALVLEGSEPASAQTGPLPEGATHTLRFAGVRAEIGVTFPVPMAAARAALRSGLEPVPFSSVAATDPVARRMLEARPELAEMAAGILGWASMDTVLLDGARTGSGGAVTVAFVWLPVSGTGPPRSVTPATAIPLQELGFWSAARDLVGPLAVDRPLTALAGATLEPDRSGGWAATLSLADGTRLRATCRPGGTEQRPTFPDPFYQAVFAPRPAEAVTILTGGGHRIRTCDATLDGTVGERTSWAGALTLLRGVPVSATLQSGWTANGASYRAP
ncbi:MAG: hypothetical protein AB7R55_02135 [Gemmatimonadales bacterium]